MYRALDRDQQARMVSTALQQLEASRFEAEMNLVMSDLGGDVDLGGETASQRIARLDRQIERLLETYGELL